LKEETRYDEQ
jgi:Ca2+-binding EF-hand superfamily protein